MKFDMMKFREIKRDTIFYVGENSENEHAEGTEMSKFIVRGGNVLAGNVKVSGAKNSVLPIIAASLLGEDSVSIIRDAPPLDDVMTINKVLESVITSYSIHYTKLYDRFPHRIGTKKGYRMDLKAAGQFIDEMWGDSIVPELVEYVRIPNKSPHFDPDWEKNGYMEDAVRQIAAWCDAQDIPGKRLEA